MAPIDGFKGDSTHWSAFAAKPVKVGFDIADDCYIDVERHLAAAMARD